MTKTNIRSGRRLRRQKGFEILEFALMAMLYIPLMIGTFITGMNIVRGIQASAVSRDLANMYIHGADFSNYNLQTVAKRLATGMNLQIGTSFTGNVNENTSNTGRGLVTISQVMRVGSTTSPNCVAVGASNCTNHDKFVFLERIRFGNGSLASAHPSSLGDTTAPRSAAGVVQDPVVTATAALNSSAQGTMNTMWQTTVGGKTPLADGQTMYVVEVYFESPDLALGAFSGNGVYSRWFF